MFRPEMRTLRLGSDASESALKASALDQYRILHFATHALLDERTTARSGIVLAMPKTNKAEDGIVRTSEILNLKLDADLVVLSACQTALGKVVRGEGIMGLTRAFFRAREARRGELMECR
jgi:CHAT domain-containing protein